MSGALSEDDEFTVATSSSDGRRCGFSVLLFLRPRLVVASGAPLVTLVALVERLRVPSW